MFCLNFDELKKNIPKKIFLGISLVLLMNLNTASSCGMFE